LFEIDLGITKFVDKEFAEVGEIVEFTITLSLEGSINTTNLVISENIPSGYEYISSSTSFGTYDSTLGEWTLPSMSAPSVNTLTIAAKAMAKGDYNNRAIITHSDQHNTNTTTEANASVTVSCLEVSNMFSPNEDGINEFLIINCIENYPNNTLEIFNRWGDLVYKKNNYNNTFHGESNEKSFIVVKNLLPVGTYYYVLTLGDGSKAKVGWIYLNR